MAKNSGKQDRNGERTGSETNRLQDDIDALFRLPLAEFTGARNKLAAQRKKSGRADEADRVKALGKPSITAWSVNQLYWNHREAFDRLIESGERFRQAQSSRHAQKGADMREALDARREALTHLSDLATALLRDAGHSPTLDTTHRITTTLEGMSAYASLADAPRPGRLTHDVDPPGFESLASFVPAAGMTKRTQELTKRTQESPRATPAQKPASVVTNAKPKPAPVNDPRQLEKMRQAGIAAAKVSLQDAKRLLIKAQTSAQRAEAAQKKASADSKEAEKQKREAEKRFEKASAAAEDADQRARSATAEVEETANALEDAQRTVDEASKEIESLLRESPAR